MGIKNQKPPKIVGFPDDGNKGYRYQYCDLPYNPDEWVPVNEWLPVPFDLVELDIGERKTRKGWYTGSGWFGYKLNEDDEVYYWRRREHYHMHH